MMRIILTLLIVAFSSATFTATAQSNEECLQLISIFSEHAKIKNYDAAEESFKKLRANCPGYHFVLYQYGEKLMKHRIENAADDKKKAAIDDLAKFYEEKKTNFPEKTKVGDDLSDIAYLYHSNNIGTLSEEYAAYGRAWETDAETFNNAKYLYDYFIAALELNEEGGLELQEIFDLYDQLQDKITDQQNYFAKRLSDLIKKEEDGETLTAQEKRVVQVAEPNLKALSQVSGFIDSKLSNVADCDRLVPFYEEDFEEEKGNVEWVKRAAGRLLNKECKDAPLFVKLVEQLNTLEPSAESSFYLGQLAEKRGELAKALKYYEESVERQDDPAKKAKVLYSLGQQYQAKGQYSTARKYYLEAVELQPSYARVYLQIAEMYAQSANTCGDTEFNKRAVYWKAAEMASRAGRINPSLAGAAKKAADYYNQLAPSRTMIFEAGNAGTRVSIPCWVGGSVTVPNL
ncbi:MAG: tetratricopeptide repeat protein [Leeuwenhoekiella sp.]